MTERSVAVHGLSKVTQRARPTLLTVAFGGGRGWGCADMRVCHVRALRTSRRRATCEGGEGRARRESRDADGWQDGQVFTLRPNKGKGETRSQRAGLWILGYPRTLLLLSAPELARTGIVLPNVLPCTVGALRNPILNAPGRITRWPGLDLQDQPRAVVRLDRLRSRLSCLT